VFSSLKFGLCWFVVRENIVGSLKIIAEVVLQNRANMISSKKLALVFKKDSRLQLPSLDEGSTGAFHSGVEALLGGASF
jgi:hypothetical protein